MSQKILIVDDEPNILVSLEYLMKREGYEVLARARRTGGARRAAPRAPATGAARRDDAQARAVSRSARNCVPTRRSGTRLVLMLTAKGRDTDVAKGLGVGRRRLRDQAVLDPRTGGEGARAAGGRRVRRDRRLLAAIGVAALGAAVLVAALDRRDRGAGRVARSATRRAASVVAALAPHVPLVVLTSLMLVGVVALVVQALLPALGERPGAPARAGAGAALHRRGTGTGASRATPRCAGWRRRSTTLARQRSELQARRRAEGGRRRAAASSRSAAGWRR